MTKQQQNDIINETLTNMRELRRIAGEMEVLGHRTFNTPGLDAVSGICVEKLRAALEALDASQRAIKDAGRALYIIDMPSLAMTADAA
ncbi:hypothetical protein ELG97_37215 [Rhizobium leguminosarum]|uniref:hypothetical protein n=1 Tax=Rhizobium leguminosarum TaxID=384 RepID=UPI001030365D|nr:hypothetical protein [Rhizobium leguminosarum]TBE73872.1 hypothetical protein ELG97_37215 [Rhizobium leguminosarum]